jgi:hypothetical protein
MSNRRAEGREKTMSETTNPRRLGAIGRLAILSFLVALISFTGAASASAAVKWRSETMAFPTRLVAGESGEVQVWAFNHGDTKAGLTNVKVDLPPGVTFNNTFNRAPDDFNLCSGEGTSSTTCKWFGGAEPGAHFEMIIGVDVAPGTSGDLPFAVTVSGGGPGAVSSVESGEIRTGSEPLGFGFAPGSLIASTFDEEGNDFTQAGGFPPVAIGSFDVNAKAIGKPAGGNPKDIITELPPGFVGNPTAVPRCKRAEFPDCPPETQIGIIRLRLAGCCNPALPVYGVYNLVPPADRPAEFGFRVHIFEIIGKPSVRADGDYAIRFDFSNLPESLQPMRTELEIWGVPGALEHDFQRCETPNHAPVEPTCNGLGPFGGTPNPSPNPAEQRNRFPNPGATPVKPFLANPTSCANEVVTKFHMTLWQDPAPSQDLTDPRWLHFNAPAPDLTGCHLLPFDPTIDFEPTTNQADSPTGLDIDLNIPQDGWEDPDKLATAHLKKTTVTLPEGMAFNASAANGLEACTTQQIGLISAPGEKPRFDNVEPSCPTASKLANATVTTPLLHDQLHGEVFLAAQDDNPFADTYAIYIVVREPSILVKLPGKVDLDPNTGQITTTFDQNPQLPFSDLELDFFGGERAALATPLTCGGYTTTTEFVPWSAKDPENPTADEIVVGKDPFAITGGANGAPCPASLGALPFEPTLQAGSENPLAGAHSPFSIRIERPDGSQELHRLNLAPPPGFTASLKGMPYCSEAAISRATNRASGKDEQSSPSCPKASEIGTTLAGAGAGDAPFYAPGKVYLAGPYRGAPLSAVAITPAVAGPFDLGNVLVRSAIEIDPRTARITASTDPLPRAIDGVPLRIKDLRIELDRPNWAINPTNCSEMAVNVTAFGSGGASSKLANRFQLGGCRALGFKPKLGLKLLGGTKRAGHPALRAVVRPRPGDANFASAAVTLPSSAFLDQAHIRTICTRVQFAADSCPPGAIYGKATATTPLLDQPISGPVYLRSSDNNLPDLVADLRGPARQPIGVELVGRIDSVNGGIRNTFDVLPDAPVTKFVLEMQGGKKGLITNSRNLCASTNRAKARLGAQNGRVHSSRPVVVAAGCKGKRGKGGARRG